MADEKPVLDLSDRLVRGMVERNHTPVERWTFGGELMDVTCEQCSHPWPCETRRELLAYQQATPEGLTYDRRVLPWMKGWKP